MKKEHVIKKYSEFQTIIKKHKFKRSKNFTVYFQKKDENYTRIGILVSKRNGIAVIRNRIKRQVRMISDLVLNYTENMDCIIAIAPQYNVDEYKNNEIELINLLNSVKGELNE